MAQYNDSIAGGIRGTKRFRKDQKQFYSSKVDKSQTIYSNNTDLTTVGYNKFSDKVFFRVFVKKLAVPSAVFNAIFPVNPSVTITFESPFVI